MNPPLLEVRDLRVRFETERGPADVVNGMSFTVAAGETLALVGESGCGKTVTALAILRLLGAAGRIVGGEVRFDGRNVLELAPRDLRALRGRAIGMVFQDPVASLNPVLTCGDQIAEVVRAHAGCSRPEARTRALELLRRVRLPDPERQARSYPHQMSGGMCQRIGIALALAGAPRLLIADEPTTALDVTVQAQLCDLLRELQSETGMALLLVSHDLGLVAGLADRVAIAYAGHVVECAPVDRLFSAPQHPYTRGLLRAVPDIETGAGRFVSIPGAVPHPAEVPPYCRFQPRCTHRIDVCERQDPAPRAVQPEHLVACWVDIEPTEPWAQPGGRS